MSTHAQPRGADSSGAEPPASSRRWVILAIVASVALVGTYNQLTISALAPEIAAELDVSNSQMASLMMAPMLSGVFLAVLTGGLGDRYGVKRVVAVAFVVSLIGVTLRMVAESYLLMFVAMFLLGLAAVVASANVAKLLGAWFPARQIGLAMGGFMAAGPLGSAAAQATGARFPSVQAAYLFGAGLFVVIFALWLIVVQNRPADAPQPPEAEPVTAYLGKVARNRHVWLLAAGMMLFMGAQMTFSSFLPAALNADKGLDLADAGTVAAVFTVGSLIGSIGAPAVAAGIGRIKPVIIGGALLGMVAIYVAWLAAPGGLSVVVLIVAGATLGSAAPLIMAAPALLHSVGPRYAGSAGGLIGMLQAGGAFVVPTFLIAPIAGTDYTLLVGMSAVCGGLIALAVAFVPEYGRRPHRARDAMPVEPAA